MAPQLEKWLWTDADFEQMSWHDARIYAIRVDSNIWFDIDYIYQWDAVDTYGFYSSFWVAPCTLVFEPVWSFSFEIKAHPAEEYLEILRLHREEQSTWRIETQLGDIRIQADGFRQIFRRVPSHQHGQHVIPEERGLSSFSEKHESAYVEPEAIRVLKELDFAKQTELKQLAKTYERLRTEYYQNEYLHSERLYDTKAFIIKKRELVAQMDHLKKYLKEQGGFGYVKWFKAL